MNRLSWCVLVFCLAGCGTRGPLFLPPATPAPTQPPAPAKAAADDIKAVPGMTGR